MELEFSVKGQVISRTDNEDPIVNETANYIDSVFTFTTSEWNGLDKYALFKAEKGKAYCVELGSGCTGTVKVPYEVLQGDFFRVTVFGLSGTYRVTTTELTVFMDRSGFTDDLLAPVEYNGDIFSQLRELISNCLVNVELQGNQLLFFKEDTVYFSFTVDNHSHTSSQVSDLEDTIGLEIKRSYQLLSNKIRTYGG